MVRTAFVNDTDARSSLPSPSKSAPPIPHPPPPPPIFIPPSHFTPSRCPHLLALQIMPAQSRARMQLLPAPQGGHIAPPQSVSVSSWFLIMSRHVGFGLHAPPMQMPLWQSPLAAHALPSGHLPHFI